LLGPFNITRNSGKIVGSGGLPPPANPANFPFPTTNQFPVTAGNRSGDFAISANAIDALLLGTGAPAVAPGIFGLAGVMTNPQFQVVIRALNQKKGIDVLSAPRVTTKSGQRAVIEIVREFRYPTQFQPPQIPQTFAARETVSGTASVSGNSNGAFPVTPTTPTAFETRNTGVTLEVELGGLMREDVQKTEDRTPILGDIPIVGRLFRSNAEQHIKRNLVIFVTARLVNPGGQPVNSTEEVEESELIEPPILPEVPFYKK